MVSESNESAKVLILDDDELATKTLKLLLKAQTPYEIFSYTSAVEAIDFLKENEVDVVVSDFMMPEMDGIEFLSEVKKLKPSITSILLTGYADKENAIKAINEVGLYKYIEKPWDNDELILNIKNAIERSQLVETIKIQKEIERLRSDFVATLTHDLRTPLHADIRTLEYFLDGTFGDLSEKQKQFLEAMMRSNKDMLALVNNLLDVYKMEANLQQFNMENIDIAEVICSSIQELENIAKNKNVSIKTSMPESGFIFADRQSIKRVVTNFLANAINYAKTNVFVNLEVNEEKIRFSVKDDGDGISKEDSQKLFGRFSQGTSKKRSTGTGLGLYLSKQIIDAHSGFIGLNSELGQGSEFYFELYKGRKDV